MNLLSYNHQDCESFGEILISDVGMDNKTMIPPLSNSSYNTTGAVVQVPTYIYVYMTAINLLVFVVGVVGNILVVVVVCSVRGMRNPTNYFLLTLSVADMFVLFICQPVAIMEFYNKERWYLGEFMCEYY
ncbi:hypothetical protein DPMN_165376 [Dreissena polymorpha]|uniref:G-protein coupled receptors family 1 profile domain-containing protein n=1 Tax=Dreissena polymorpha TaxID=45954 RepID=A0A9D4EZJ5_DREPO|nr:hypothetical protein DPMN_165376 [Dreissena polymorpha]